MHRGEIWVISHSSRLFSLLAIMAFVIVAGASLSGWAGEHAFTISYEKYYDKVLGEWEGKCCGGALGMPIEGWNYQRIAREYGEIHDYIGYFTDRQVGWTGVCAAVSIPADRQWHEVTAAVRVPPDLDPQKLYPRLIVGLTPEFSKEDAVFEVKSISLVKPEAPRIAFDRAAFNAENGAAWKDKPLDMLGAVSKAEPLMRFESKAGSRAWAKLNPRAAKALALKPSQEIEVKIEARLLSGHNRLAIAFDKMSLEPVPGFGPDDDTTYQIIGLHSIEEFGSDVTSEQIAGEWLKHLYVPEKGMLAEQIALRRVRDGIMPPESGKHSSSEAIGGQMKAEIWGLVCPGDPARAADYGRRDGIVAHAGNGVYGEMFMAAVAAEAFKHDAASWKGDAKKANADIRKLLEAGLGQIPSDCQYAAVVRWVMQMHQDGVPWREALRRTVEKYPSPCNPVFGDAGIVCLGLLYGDGDFEKSLCITAMCGQDTDCDTASVGAVLGCLHGAKALPEKWTKPLGNTFRCFGKDLPDWTEWKITELAAQICQTGAWVSPETVKPPLR